jgi:hypothetical protein
MGGSPILPGTSLGNLFCSPPDQEFCYNVSELVWFEVESSQGASRYPAVRLRTTGRPDRARHSGPRGVRQPPGSNDNGNEYVELSATSAADLTDRFFVALESEEGGVNNNNAGVADQMVDLESYASAYTTYLAQQGGRRRGSSSPGRATTSRSGRSTRSSSRSVASVLRTGRQALRSWKAPAPSPR